MKNSTITSLCVGILVVFGSAANAQAPRQLEPAELANQMYSFQERKIPVPTGTFKVSGERRWDGFFLSAERIEFEPGAKLIFSPLALSRGSDLFIITREIISLSQENPGEIMYESVDDTKNTPPISGHAQAASGYPGDGNVGATGNNGVAGNQGYRGASGPHLTLLATKVAAPLVVILPGINGGSGGAGQTGGQGGSGGNGSPASQNCCNCTSGAGNGGPGGMGGAGGPGGIGGAGGNGGTFTLITAQENIPAATTMLRVNVSAGKGGPGGAGGNPGNGGQGGQGGQEARPWCRGNGSGGPIGNSGKVGPIGAIGPDGAQGVYLFGSLSTADVEKIIKPGS